MNQLYFPYQILLKKTSSSERALSKKSQLSRSTIRKISNAESNINLAALEKLASAFDCNVNIFVSPKSNSEFSTIAISAYVIRDGFASWKIHFMNLVDEFRRVCDPRLLMFEPLPELDHKLKALLASICRLLSEEIEIPAPDWAKKSYFLKEPWFLSEAESLKAFSILESPLAFRSNNIFVLNNFLDRT